MFPNVLPRTFVKGSEVLPHLHSYVHYIYVWILKKQDTPGSGISLFVCLFVCFNTHNQVNSQSNITMSIHHTQIHRQQGEN